jgi:hypothetical protein
MNNNLSHELLIKQLFYDSATGVFTRLIARSGSSKIGDIAGHISKEGYICIRINGKSYKAHRLAWFYVTGEWPGNEIDHKDRNRSNNTFANLRLASHLQNTSNRSMNKNNLSGYKGVSIHKESGKWVAQIGIHGKRTHIGLFETKEDAAIAYNTLAIKHYGCFANLNVVNNG